MEHQNLTERLKGTLYIKWDGKKVYENTEKENTDSKEGQLAKHNE